MQNEEEEEMEEEKHKYKINYDIEDIKNRYIYPFNNQLINRIYVFLNF